MTEARRRCITALSKEQVKRLLLFRANRQIRICFKIRGKQWEGKKGSSNNSRSSATARLGNLAHREQPPPALAAAQEAPAAAGPL